MSLSHVIFSFFFFGESGEAYRWRVCYQRGLPQLVFFFGLRFEIYKIMELYYKTSDYQIWKPTVNFLICNIVILKILKKYEGEKLKLKSYQQKYKIYNKHIWKSCIQEMLNISTDAHFCEILLIYINFFNQAYYNVLSPEQVT